MSEKKHEKCTHHWILESPNGAESSGTCKHCSATRSFRTAQSLEEIVRTSGFDRNGVSIFTIETDHEPVGKPIQKIAS